MNHILPDQSIYQQRLIEQRRQAAGRQQKSLHAAKSSMEFADPPLDLPLSGSLNDSFGWGDDDDGDDNEDLDERFERIYSQADEEGRRDDGRPWQRIHRTSFTYSQKKEDRAGLHSYTGTAAADSCDRQSIFRAPRAHVTDVTAPSALSAPRRRVKTCDALAAAAQPKGILRNPTAVSALTQTTAGNTNASSSSSPSRSSTGRSRSRSKRRSVQNDEEHHESLFRGAQLIKEQLIRSMAHVDRSRADDDEDYEDYDAALNPYRGHQRNDNNNKNTPSNASSTIDFDYSDTTSSFLHPNSDPSAIHSRLESESQRLESLIQRFARSTVVSQVEQQQQKRQQVEQQQHQHPQQTLQDPVGKSSSSDKENEQFPQDEQWEDSDRGAGNSSTASPKSTCIDLNRAEANAIAAVTADDDDPVSKSCQPTSHEQTVEYAQQYILQDQSNHPIDDNNTIVYADSPMVHSKHHQQQQQPSPSSQHDLATQYHNQKTTLQKQTTDDALTHARSAGSLWRSLVGNHVRFPPHWDQLLPPTAPHIPSPEHRWSKWYYPARHRVKGDTKLNSATHGVRNRRSGGRILMNILVKEMNSPHTICKEIAIGCFHPNSRGIRVDDVNTDLEDAREVWMGVRWVIPSHCREPILNRGSEEDIECFIDGFLTQQRHVLDYQTMGSPLGRRKAVNNENVRAVFGDEPPLTTVNLYEDELAEIIKANDSKRLSSLPGLMLLKLFLFSK